MTPSGTFLSVKLTHATIGEMVGAKRPTISLALRDLVENGALLVRDDGWLLLADPPTPIDAATSAEIAAAVHDPLD